MKPDQYDHIWEGGYVKVSRAPTSPDLAQGQGAEGRIGFVAADPLMTIRACSGTSAAPAPRPTPAHLDRPVHRPRDPGARLLRGAGPAARDARQLAAGQRLRQGALHPAARRRDQRQGVRRLLRERAEGTRASRSRRPEPGQGRGDACGSRRLAGCSRRSGSTRTTTEAGREALGWYHEKKDEKRGIGLGPDHDWSSHGRRRLRADVRRLRRTAGEARAAAAAPGQGGGWDGLADDILKEAQEAFEKLRRACRADNRKAWEDDVDFALLENQWPEKIRRERELDGRPA
jgi:hypothetical protein